jgi:hypothetical protein
VVPVRIAVDGDEPESDELLFNLGGVRRSRDAAVLVHQVRKQVATYELHVKIAHAVDAMQRTGLIILVSLVGAVRCNTSTAPCANMGVAGNEAAHQGLPAAASNLSIQYFIDAARPRTQISLVLSKKGDAELFLGTPALPLRTSVLGYFKAPVPDALRQKICTLVDGRGLLATTRGSSATAEGSGSIVLEASGRRVVLGLATADSAVNALREALDEVAAAVAKFPWRAVELTVDARRDGQRWTPEVVLHHRGTTPASILLCDPADISFCTSPTVRTIDGGRELGSWRLQRSDAFALVRGGRIPAGPFALAVGQEVRFAAAPVVTNVSNPTMSATLGLWFLGPGRARRHVDLSVEGRVANH